MRVMVSQTFDQQQARTPIKLNTFRFKTGWHIIMCRCQCMPWNCMLLCNASKCGLWNKRLVAQQYAEFVRYISFIKWPGNELFSIVNILWDIPSESPSFVFFPFLLSISLNFIGLSQVLCRAFSSPIFRSNAHSHLIHSFLSTHKKE